MKLKLLKILVLSALSLPAISKEIGGDGSGGGNEIPGIFVTDARALYQILAAKKQLVNTTLGIDIEEFKTAIDTTAVNCAFGDVLEIIRDQKKSAYYLAARKSVYLDCDTYYDAKKKGEMGPVTLFHEYMRRLDKEGDEYLVSSKLRSLVVPGAEMEFLVIDPGVQLCYESLKLPNNVDYHNNYAINISIGRDIVKCLISQGFTKKKVGIGSAKIIIKLGSLRGANLKVFSENVVQLLRRPETQDRNK